MFIQRLITVLTLNGRLSHVFSLLASKFDKILDGLAGLFAAKWLHCRGLETALCLVAAIFGFSLLFHPNESMCFREPNDFWLFVHTKYFGIPFILYAAISAAGIALNIYGSCYAKKVRIFGLTLGMLLWFLLFYTLVIFKGSLGFLSFCIVAAISSIRLLGLAGADWPPADDPCRAPLDKSKDH